MSHRPIVHLLIAIVLGVAASSTQAAEPPGAHWYSEQGRDAQREIQRDLQRDLRRNLRPMNPERPEFEQIQPPQAVDNGKPAQEVSAA